MKVIVLLSFFLFTISKSFAQNPNNEKLNLNTHWAFYRGDLKNAERVDFDDSSFEAVTIPHVMRLEKKHNGGTVYQGLGWYRRYFKLSEKYKNKRLQLVFDGVQTNCVIYLNGKTIAEHHGGYMGFIVDITDKVNFNTNNVLAVKVSNQDDPLTPPGKPMSGLDFNYYGGIYRNVFLSVTDNIYVTHPLEPVKGTKAGLYVSYDEVTQSHARVNLTANIANKSNSQNEVTLISKLIDRENHIVASSETNTIISPHAYSDVRQMLDITNPNLWHPDQPYLYRLVSEVKKGKETLYREVNRIGIRKFAFESPEGKSEGFYINGKKFYIRGANRHQAFQYVGDAASDGMQLRDAIQLKEGGFNALRAAHYPSSPEFLNACDSIGLLVIECQPGWQFYSQDSIFINRTYRDIREMIRRDRNHPSIFLWETALNESPTPDSWMQRAVEIAHEELPGEKYVTSDDFNKRSKQYYDVFYKLISQDGTDPMPDKPSLTREWGDTWLAEVSKENSLRASRIYTEKGLINQCILRQNALNGETSEKKGGYWDHSGLDANPRIAGYFLWSFNDYTRGYDRTTAFSGVVDLDRYPKFSYYHLKSMQSAYSKAYGPDVFIASFNNRPDLDSTIYVFSNCDSVALYSNNKFIGLKTRSENNKTAPFVAAKGGSPYYKFDFKKYESGELFAKGYLKGKVVCSHKVATSEKAYGLKIEFPQKEVTENVRANGYEMIPFYVKVEDKNGTLVSNAYKSNSHKIKISVTGEGCLIGGNIPELNISEQYTEGGIGYGIIRVSRQAGKITINASSEGLKSARTITVTQKNNEQSVPDGKHNNWISEYQTEARKSPGGKVEDGITSGDRQIEIEKIVVEGDSGSENNWNAMFDDDVSTRWEASKRNNPIEIVAKLSKQEQVKGVQFFWGKDSDWYTYKIEGSIDGTSWQELQSTKKVSGQFYQPIMFSKPLKVNFVKIHISDIQPEGSKVAIKEMRFLK